MRHFVAISLCAFPLAACGVVQQAPPGETRETKYIESEYGTGAGAPITVRSDGRDLTFVAWLGTKHPRILVQSTPDTSEAMRASLTRLSLGVIDRPLDEKPYRAAAMQHLAATGKADCTLRSGGQSPDGRFEWTYSCGRP